jgi:hypothetical protein
VPILVALWDGLFFFFQTISVFKGKETKTQIR